MTARTARPVLVLLSYASSGMKFHLHRVADFEEKQARVFHSHSTYGT
jgi:hypothetical protein